MQKLISGEISLTIDILIGLAIGEIILRLKLADILLRKFMPFLQRHNIPPVTCLALAVSAGSPKAGAAIISSALANNTITQNCALWSVLMLQFPPYLRRWPGTCALAISMAGNAGLFFALSLIFSTTIRFIIAFIFLKREKVIYNSQDYEIQASKHRANLLKKLIKTLPLAWLFFALAFSLVPVANNFFKSIFSANNSFMPLAGWAVAASSIAHVSAALALAGGSLASDELNTAQAVFALILGNCLGTVTRILRKNAGYYFGFFPPKIAQKMLLMNFITILLPIILCLIFAFLILSLLS